MLLLMMVFTGLVFAAMRYVELPVGRALHAALIVGPAAWLARTPPRRIAIAVLLLIGLALVWTDVAPLLLAADVAPLLWIGDLTLYLDALLLVAGAFAVVQVRSIGRLISGSLRCVGAAGPSRQSARARSSKPRRPKRSPPANDDEPGFSSRMVA